jgi:hypothetical protein
VEKGDEMLRATASASQEKRRLIEAQISRHA